MLAYRLARRLGGKIHYGWVVVAITFAVIVCAVGVRAAAGVMIVPLERAFGWSAASISGAVSLNIALFGLVGPFTAALMRSFGLRRTVMASMLLLSIGTGLSAFISTTWQ